MFYELEEPLFFLTWPLACENSMFLLARAHWEFGSSGGACWEQHSAGMLLCSLDKEHGLDVELPRAEPQAAQPTHQTNHSHFPQHSLAAVQMLNKECAKECLGGAKQEDKGQREETDAQEVPLNMRENFFTVQ